MPSNIIPIRTSNYTLPSVGGTSETTCTTTPNSSLDSCMDTVTSRKRSFTNAMGYDEVYTPRGSVRAPYANILPLLEKRTIGQVSKFEKRTLKDFHGDNVVVTVPRILTQSENRTLRAGVTQRAKAIYAFLQDYYSGKMSFLQGDVIPKSVLTQIIDRAGEGPVKDWLKPEDIGFFYGPDLIRGPKGNFYIIEDNLGYVGGMGDLLKARKVMFQHMPELRGAINTPKSDVFYADMVKSYRALCKGGSDTVVFLRYPSYACADTEDDRLQKIFLKHGVETVVVDDTEDGRYRNKLQVKNDGVYLKTKGKRARKVGYVIANMEPSETDPGHPAVYVANLKRTILEMVDEVSTQQKKLSKSESPDSDEVLTLNTRKSEIKNLLIPGVDGELDISSIETFLNAQNPDAVQNLKESGIPGLLNAFYEGQVGMNNTPGAEFIGDKELYIFVENMINFYLGEEPIISNLPTKTFRTYNELGKEVLDQDLFNEIFNEETKNKDSHVIKRVDGRGGAAVWVGAKISWEEFSSLKDIIKAEPDAFIVQQYTALSQVDGHLVDLRLLSTVNSQGPIVAPVPWGRAVPAKGSNGKVNISDQGGEQTVMVNGPMETPPRKRRRVSVKPTLASTRARRPGVYDSFTPYKIRHIGE